MTNEHHNGLTTATDAMERVAIALCENALGGKACPCKERGVFNCADAYPGYQARAAIAALASTPAVADGLVKRTCECSNCWLSMEARTQLQCLRTRETQMLGAALSRRNWHDTETAYNHLRDRLDRILAALSPVPASDELQETRDYYEGMMDEQDKEIEQLKEQLAAVPASGAYQVMRDALTEARTDLALAVKVPLADPYLLVDLRALCERHGYGNVMSSASALWRERLGDVAGGEFVAGPCRVTVERLIAKIDEALTKSPPQEAVEAIPADVAKLVLRIGRAEWGQTPAHDAEGHGAHIADSVRITAEQFGQEGPQNMQGLYVEGTETVICHTGTSPNSPQIARALTGAWNKLHSLALKPEQVADAPNPRGSTQESER